MEGLIHMMTHSCGAAGKQNCLAPFMQKQHHTVHISLKPSNYFTFCASVQAFVERKRLKSLTIDKPVQTLTGQPWQVSGSQTLLLSVEVPQFLDTISSW
jgi:hypothetical protein